MEVDFKSLVERIQTGERDYVARLSTEGTEYRETPSLFVKAIDEAARQIEAVVSDASVDRDEEIILPSAFSEMLGEYLKNPVIISAHQNRLDTGHSSVIGQALKVWIAKDGLHVNIWFAETELGNEFWYLYKNKFQRAFSVGFIPLEWTDETVNGARVRTFTKAELLEISCVPVPSNRNALSRSKQRKQDFIADKIAQRKMKDEDLAEVLIVGDFKALGIPEIDAENLDPEPDYAGIAKGILL
ncbi:MAG: HK97 family phage prohead protease [Sedimentisphaerales bacterium]|jgi:HK97 family phage prohead protease